MPQQERNENLHPLSAKERDSLGQVRASESVLENSAPDHPGGRGRFQMDLNGPRFGSLLDIRRRRNMLPGVGSLGRSDRCVETSE